MSAGYTFLIEYDENGQLLDPGMWRGQQQLKHLVEVMEESEYDSIYKTYMEPTVF